MPHSAYSPSTEDEDEEHDDQNKSLPQLSSGLQESQTVCNFLTAQMVQRCSRKGEEGGASEFRPVLANLIEDLLKVQLLPEYPGAELLLLSFCRRLSHDLIKASSVGNKRRSSSNKGPPVEATYLSTAMVSAEVYSFGTGGGYLA
jgi:hypothetical protein